MHLQFLHFFFFIVIFVAIFLLLAGEKGYQLLGVGVDILVGDVGVDFVHGLVV